MIRQSLAKNHHIDMRDTVGEQPTGGSRYYQHNQRVYAQSHERDRDQYGQHDNRNPRCVKSIGRLELWKCLPPEFDSKRRKLLIALDVQFQIATTTVIIDAIRSVWQHSASQRASPVPWTRWICPSALSRLA